jgi:hypothetical protein
MSNFRIREEEIVLRGRELYERVVRPELGPEHEDKFVVIDVQTGDYEVADDEELAFERAEKKHPQTLFFVLRVGPEASEKPAYRVGAGGATYPGAAH